MKNNLQPENVRPDNVRSERVWRDIARYQLRKWVDLKGRWAICGAWRQLGDQSRVCDAVVSSLQANGIAQCSLDDLLGVKKSAQYMTLLNELRDNFVSSESFQQQYQNIKSIDIKDTATKGKNHLIRLIGAGEPVHRDHILRRLFSETEITASVEKYLRLQVELKTVDYKYTIPCADTPRSTSRNWHRDPLEPSLVKVFVYLSDVDSDCGPLEYVARSHRSPSKYLNYLKNKRVGYYLSDKAFADELGNSAVLKATGEKGSVFFVDTSGIHRGGHCERPREFVNALYTSPLCRRIWNPLV